MGGRGSGSERPQTHRAPCWERLRASEPPPGCRSGGARRARRDTRALTRDRAQPVTRAGACVPRAAGKRWLTSGSGLRAGSQTRVLCASDQGLASSSTPRQALTVTCHVLLRRHHPCLTRLSHPHPSDVGIVWMRGSLKRVSSGRMLNWAAGSNQGPSQPASACA